MSCKSLPMWECGLKHVKGVDGWGRIGHSPCGSVDWNFPLLKTIIIWICHSPCGSVDWNYFRCLVCCPQAESLPMWECGLKLSQGGSTSQHHSHSPCGSVDWNITRLAIWVMPSSHSPCGSVDWNLTVSASDEDFAVSLPMWECGLKRPCSFPFWQ